MHPFCTPLAHAYHFFEIVSKLSQFSIIIAAAFFVSIKAVAIFLTAILSLWYSYIVIQYKGGVVCGGDKGNA